MAYTPINWATGDTITADKLNKMDNGWGYGSTQLFSETVTTANQGGMNSANLAYNGTIDADTIAVTFDGTDYTCPRIDAFGSHFYGGFTEQGAVFTEYPFVVMSESGGNHIYTETANTHTITAVAATMQTSTNFAAAVNTASPHPTLYVEQDRTTWQQVRDAMRNGIITIFIINNTDSTEFYIADNATVGSSYEDGKYRVSFNRGAFTMLATSSDGVLQS